MRLRFGLDKRAISRGKITGEGNGRQRCVTSMQHAFEVTHNMCSHPDRTHEIHAIGFQSHMVTFEINSRLHCTRSGVRSSGRRRMARGEIADDTLP